MKRAREKAAGDLMADVRDPALQEAPFDRTCATIREQQLAFGRRVMNYLAEHRNDHDWWVRGGPVNLEELLDEEGA